MPLLATQATMKPPAPSVLGEGEFPYTALTRTFTVGSLAHAATVARGCSLASAKIARAWRIVASGMDPATCTCPHEAVANRNATSPGAPVWTDSGGEFGDGVESPSPRARRRNGHRHAR